METIRIPRILQETSRMHRSQGKGIGFVPTMGALHEGHLSLVRRAREENDILVVSIFVNPLQFGPQEDFNKYPRDIEMDIEKLQKEGVHTLFMPEPASLYPSGFSTSIGVKGLSEKLCGAYRPGHFTGVATVVCKLFNLVKPSKAYFGQKDYQQTVVIKRMTEDLNMDVELVVCPTVREREGLAMSSRNTYLNPEQRKAALSLYAALTAASHRIQSGTSAPEEIKKLMQDALQKEPLLSEVQYAGVYDPVTLDELHEFMKENLLAVAVKIGSTRLIDNMLLTLHK